MREIKEVSLKIVQLFGCGYLNTVIECKNIARMSK